MAKSGDLVFVSEPSYDRGTRVINVFRANASAPGTYAHVAVLAPRGGGPLFESFDVSGNIVIASGAETAYIFELPASLTAPTPRQDNFESGNAAGWTRSRDRSSQWSRAVRTASTGRAAPPARLAPCSADTNWTNQAIEAQITPTGVRRQRSMGRPRHALPGRAELLLRDAAQLGQRAIEAHACRSLQHHRFHRLPVTLNRSYRVRLESIGSVHRVYVTAVLLLDVDDAGAPRQGSAGITMYRARADFDNVVGHAEPAHHGLRRRLRAHGAASINGRTAAAASGPLRRRVRAKFRGPRRTRGHRRAHRRPGGPGAGAPDRVVLDAARRSAGPACSRAMSTPRNYYYLHLRSGGTVSLRKLVNGTIFTLASAPFAGVTQHSIRVAPRSRWATSCAAM